MSLINTIFPKPDFVLYAYEVSLDKAISAQCVYENVIKNPSKSNDKMYTVSLSILKDIFDTCEFSSVDEYKELFIKSCNLKKINPKQAINSLAKRKIDIFSMSDNQYNKVKSQRLLGLGEKKEIPDMYVQITQYACRITKRKFYALVIDNKEYTENDQMVEFETRIGAEMHLKNLLSKNLITNTKKIKYEKCILNEKFDFKLNQIEFGSSVLKNEMYKVISDVNIAFDDLYKVMNVSPQFMSLYNRIKIVYSKFPYTSKRAKASYHRKEKVISLGKQYKGSIAHEFAHALDHYLCDRILTEKNQYLSECYLMDESENEICDAMNFLFKKIMTLDFYNESKKVDKKIGNHYYAKCCEIFARCFEVYINGVCNNNTLAELESNLHYLYPSFEEIEYEMKALIEVL